MIHFTCDRCAKPMFEDSPERFEVTIDARLANEPMLCQEQDPESDALDLTDEQLSRRGEDADEPVFYRLSIDLCKDCAKAFMHDPMPRAVPGKRFNFLDQ